jgi:plasmid stabilization system protein ParE
VSRVIYHPAVQRDVDQILGHYYKIAPHLEDEFFAEFQEAVERAAAFPERAHLDRSGLRRVNFLSFPYHLLFRIRPGKVRITVVRHHKRNVSYGTRRI